MLADSSTQCGASVMEHFFEFHFQMNSRLESLSFSLTGLHSLIIEDLYARL